MLTGTSVHCALVGVIGITTQRLHTFQKGSKLNVTNFTCLKLQMGLALN